MALQALLNRLKLLLPILALRIDTKVLLIELYSNSIWDSSPRKILQIQWPSLRHQYLSYILSFIDQSIIIFFTTLQMLFSRPKISILLPQFVNLDRLKPIPNIHSKVSSIFFFRLTPEVAGRTASVLETPPIVDIKGDHLLVLVLLILILHR